MAANFSKPEITDVYANVLAEIRDNNNALALLLDPAYVTPTNVPTQGIRWNSAYDTGKGRFEKYNGTTWDALSTNYSINISGNAATSTTSSTCSGLAATATILATSRTIDGVGFNGSANITVIAPATHAAAEKTTPVDADEVGISDSAASWVLKKLTWANIKATLKTYFDSLYLPLAGGILTGDLTLGFGKKLIFEGTTDNAHELTIDPGDPTADRTQTHQNTSGTIALVGVREVLGCWPAAALKPTTTSGAATVAWEESTTNKVMTGYMAFDKDTVEYAQFSFRAPSTLDETTYLQACFIWKEASGATSHRCVWQVGAQAQGDGDTIDSAWGVEVSVFDDGTSGTRRITPATAFTVGGTWAAGDEIIVRVSRKATDIDDTLDVDGHLIEVVLFAIYANSEETVPT